MEKALDFSKNRTQELSLEDVREDEEKDVDEDAEDEEI